MLEAVEHGGIRVVIEGCGHGEMEKIYETIAQMEAKNGFKVDLLICCGDFQSVRNYDDLETMSCPPKYRFLNTFYKYYSGEAVAPVLTLFIGGNHEAANYLWELYHGGWVAPNIFFLGYAGVVNFGGLRIGGISGIENDHHYKLGHYEAPPYNPKSIKSAYHIRELEVLRLMQIKQPLDVFLSHDWPRGVYYHGNTEQLLRKKPYFRREVEQNILGSAAGQLLMGALQPSYWFSAHLHVKHAALVSHPPGPGQDSGKFTKFLALDKCLPGRDFLQMVHFPEVHKGRCGPLRLEYDAEWLAILRATHDALSTEYRAKPIAVPTPAHLQEHLEHTKALLAERGSAIPENFCQTAPALPPGAAVRRGRMPAKAWKNPQTVEFLAMLGLEYNLDVGHGRPERGPTQAAAAVPNPEEIALDDDDETTERIHNPEEIVLDDEGDGCNEDAPKYTEPSATSDSMFEAVEIHGSSLVDRRAA